MARIDAFLKLVIDQNASDLHIIAGSPPIIRVNGDLFKIKFRNISNVDAENFLKEIMPKDIRKRFENEFEVDFSYTIPGWGRFRVNVYLHRLGIGAAFRYIPDKIKSLEELNLPPSLRQFAFYDKGLVLVTGPTGSGKSTTLATIIDIINSERKKHILTIEDPIEFVHERKKSIISQREVSRHTKDFASALRAASRGAADVIMIGEMRDMETMAMALTCAETGSLVFATLHTTSAAKAVTRIIDSFPSDRQSQIRAMLSMSLKGVIAQKLLKKVGGKGRVPAVEILVSSPALANIIREGRFHQINTYIESSDKEKTGMQSFDQSLLDLLNRNLISPETALENARDKTRFKEHLEQALIDTRRIFAYSY